MSLQKFNGLKFKVMKNIILTLTVAICIGTQLKATDPVISDKCCPVVVSTSDVNFSYDEAVYSKHFAPAYFNKNTNSLHFEAFKHISFIQIFNAEGKLVYKLPVMSNKVRISKNMFDKGDYKVEFQVKDSLEPLYSYVTIN